MSKETEQLIYLKRINKALESIAESLKAIAEK